MFLLSYTSHDREDNHKRYEKQQAAKCRTLYPYFANLVVEGLVEADVAEALALDDARHRVHVGQLLRFQEGLAV